MVFVADDFGAWLVAVLADAGRRQLATLVFGGEQQRALRRAATSAVQQTAQELRPDDSSQAVYGLALVISQVFGEQVPASPRAGHATLLEELQAQVAGQLAVLDDADLTGISKSSAGPARPTGRANRPAVDWLPSTGNHHSRRTRGAAGSVGGSAEPLRDSPARPAD